MFDRRADRPEGAPEDPYAKDIRALWPSTRQGEASVYRGKRNGMLSDLVMSGVPVSDTETLGNLQRAGFIVWEG